jgi:hypothetical protein
MNILTIYLCLLGLATYLGITWIIIWYFDEEKEGTLQVAFGWPLFLFFILVLATITFPIWSYFVLFTDKSLEDIYE